MERLNVGRAYPWHEATPTRVVLEKLRGAVAENESGLIHGQCKDESGGMCAMACLEAVVAREFDAGGPRSLVIDLNKDNIPEEVAAVNDSVPDATPLERKAKVLAWIDERLAKLPAEEPKTAPEPVAA